MPTPSPMSMMVPQPSQLVGSRIFVPHFSQPTIPVPQLGISSSSNMWGDHQFFLVSLGKTLLLVCHKPVTIHSLEGHHLLVLFLEGHHLLVLFLEGLVYLGETLLLVQYLTRVILLMLVLLRRVILILFLGRTP